MPQKVRKKWLICSFWQKIFFFSFFQSFSSPLPWSECPKVLHEINQTFEYSKECGVSKSYVKFGLSEKHTKICAIFLMVWTFTSKCKNHEKVFFFKFCVLLRKSELYIKWISSRIWILWFFHQKTYPPTEF